VRRKSHAPFGLGVAGKGPALRAPRRRPTSAIWHNLCEYAGKAVARHQDCLAGSGCARQGRPDAQQQEQQEQEQEQEKEGGVPAGLEAVIRGRHAAVRELRAAGRTLPEAAAALGLSQQLTGRFWLPPARTRC
jgi:hypothetical protein